jgi:hypothetical protein
VAPLEAAQFDTIQAGTLRQLRNACLCATQWSDSLDSDCVAVVGDEPLPGEPGSSALGWEWHSIFRGGHMVVWRCAADMVVTLEATVAQLRTDGSSLRASVVCKTLGDAAALYSALVLRPSQPFTAARRGLVHINSLQYLADEVALLPLTVAPDAPARDDVAAAAAAAAATLSASADEQRGVFVKRLGGLVKKTLHELPHLVGMGRKGGLAARKLVQKACTSLRSVAEALAKTCVPAEQVALFCGVLGIVCSHVAAKIFALRDISPQDCDEIKAVFERLWTDVPATAAGYFLQSAPGGARHERDALAAQWPPRWSSDMLAGMLRRACQPLRKLEAIGQLLSDRMVDIVANWESGRLADAGLSAHEVESMMRAVFEDNAHRRNCIERVQSAVQGNR